MNKDNKKFIVETPFLRETLKNNLSLKEFLVLMYFDNEYDYTFDVKKLSKATCLGEDEVLSAFGMLLDKKLLTLTSVKDEKTGKFLDRISLDNLYRDIKNNENNKKKENEKTDFFTTFQKNYNHSLSSMDYDIINAWLDTGFSEELILGALKEANYNGVLSLRYMDKILYEWKKSGLKTIEDVNNHLKERSRDSIESFDTQLLEFDWLNED